MNNIKKFYKNNRIYCILMGVSIFCLALIAVLGIVYFVNQTKNDKYGDRLNGIESVQITDDHINEMVSEIEKNELVEKASISVKGKIVYITHKVRQHALIACIRRLWCQSAALQQCVVSLERIRTGHCNDHTAHYQAAKDCKKRDLYRIPEFCHLFHGLMPPSPCS